MHFPEIPVRGLLYFIHILKCAGVSMHHAFQDENPIYGYAFGYTTIDKDNGCVQT